MSVIDQEQSVALSNDEEKRILASQLAENEGSSMHEMSDPCYLHGRGCRSISLWPRLDSSSVVPVFAATVSKDMLGVTKIESNGTTLEKEAQWKVPNPHNIIDVNAVKHASVDRIWTGCNDGIVKNWDVAGGSTEAISEVKGHFGRMTALEVWGQAGVICCSHDGGLGFVDGKAGKIIRNQATKKSVGKVCILNQDDPNLFAGIGKDLLQYDTRCWRDGVDAKPKAIGQWTMRGDVTALTVINSRKGHLLVGVGCSDGTVACFDTT